MPVAAADAHDAHTNAAARVNRTSVSTYTTSYGTTGRGSSSGTLPSVPGAHGSGSGASSGADVGGSVEGRREGRVVEKGVCVERRGGVETRLVAHTQLPVRIPAPRVQHGLATTVTATAAAGAFRVALAITVIADRSGDARYHVAGAALHVGHGHAQERLHNLPPRKKNNRHRKKTMKTHRVNVDVARDEVVPDQSNVPLSMRACPPAASPPAAQPLHLWDELPLVVAVAEGPVVTAAPGPEPSLIVERARVLPPRRHCYQHRTERQRTHAAPAAAATVGRRRQRRRRPRRRLQLRRRRRRWPEPVTTTSSSFGRRRRPPAPVVHRGGHLKGLDRARPRLRVGDFPDAQLALVAAAPGPAPAGRVERQHMRAPCRHLGTRTHIHTRWRGG